MIKQHLVSQNITFALLHRRDLVTHEPLGEWSKMAPFRVLSVDIECQGRKGCFPEAEKDAVIQIATTVQQVGDKEPFLRHVLTLNSCAPIAAAQVEAFDCEADMLLRCARCPLFGHCLSAVGPLSVSRITALALKSLLRCAH